MSKTKKSIGENLIFKVKSTIITQGFLGLKTSYLGLIIGVGLAWPRSWRLTGQKESPSGGLGERISRKHLVPEKSVSQKKVFLR